MFQKLKFFVSIIFSASILFTNSLFDSCPNMASAQESVAHKLSCDFADVLNIGSTVTAHINIDTISDISSLSISIYYDDFINVLYGESRVSNCLSFDCNILEDHTSFSFLFNDESFIYNKLLSFTFQVSNNVTPQASMFDIVVIDAYDKDLNPINVGGCIKKFNIVEAEPVIKESSIFSNYEIDTKINNQFNVGYRCACYDLGSGNFEILYNSEIFEVVNIRLDEFFNNKIYDINKAVPGKINIVFAAFEKTKSSNYLFTITFKTIKNVNANEIIIAKGYDLVSIDFNNYVLKEDTFHARVHYDPTYTDDSPNIRLVHQMIDNDLEINVYIDSDSKLGAGDFVISFNTSDLLFKSYKKEFSPTIFNVNDKFVVDGKLKFSIISLVDIVEETKMLTVTFSLLKECENKHSEISITGSGLSDSLTNPILLNFSSIEVLISEGHSYGDWKIIKEPTCTEKGIENRVCDKCGNEEIREISPKGHNFEDDWTIDVPASYYNEGSKSHHCSNCGEKKDVTPIPMLELTPSIEIEMYSSSFLEKTNGYCSEKIEHNVLEELFISFSNLSKDAQELFKIEDAILGKGIVYNSDLVEAKSRYINMVFEYGYNDFLRINPINYRVNKINHNICSDVDYHLLIAVIISFASISIFLILKKNRNA